MNTQKNDEIARLPILPKPGSTYATRKQNPKDRRMKDLQHQDLSTEKSHYVYEPRN